MSSIPRLSPRFRPERALIAAVLVAVACGEEDAPPTEQAAASPSNRTSSDAPASVLHLAERLDEVGGEASAAPERTTLSWSFAEERPEWRAMIGMEGNASEMITRRQVEGALRLGIRPGVVCGLAVDLEPSEVEWDALAVRARSSDRLAGIGVGCDVEGAALIPPMMPFFTGGEGTAPMFSDGSTQEYRLPLPTPAAGERLGTVGVYFAATNPAELDLLEVSLVPRGADYPESVGTRSVTRAGETRHTLYAHAPATLSWSLSVEDSARLDLGLSCLPGQSLRYHFEALVEGEAEPRVLDEVEIDDGAVWSQRSVDLASLAGKTIELRLRAEGPRGGEVALFGAPVVSQGSRRTRPNVVFYVIDGAGADLMSVYGYERATTPYLEELAREGVVFERAFSNSTWTQPSTASFMTSLHHSVLGGLRRGVHSTPVPDAATTFAEHMRAGGWQTGSFTANPNAGRMIGIQRGMDVLHDHETESHSTSSTDLHTLFWSWREAYPGHPWWVHFQTTDVHEPNEPVAPFAGLYVPEERAQELEEWEGRMWQAAGNLFGSTSIAAFYDQGLERAGVDRHDFYDGRRGLYDETFHYQDRELQRLVEALKARGEWENTLLVIGADHGHPAGTFARWGRGLLDPRPEPWQGALFDSYTTRVPLMFVGPGLVPEGRRITTPVSMIDVMPTVLELCGLPAPDILQGRSLVPLLRGETEEHPPVVLDEFRIDEETGQPVGNLELVDGRWGASLQIGPPPRPVEAGHGRHAVPAGGRWGAVHPFYPDAPALLLYDLETDPFATRAVNDAEPERVQHYTRLLEELWQAQQALGTRFQDAEMEALTPEQVKQLRALGYIR